jgi:tRNA pseudouridine65 synthase
MDELPILYRDDRLIAIDKPPALLMHRTRISQDRRFVLQLLRDQIGQWVYPVHRLDRPTSGVLLFGLDSAAARALVQAFEARQVQKQYLAVVRGYTPETASIDYALQEEAGRAHQRAITHYQRLATVELPLAVGRYATARYSLLQIAPATGRMHQIRKHMKHIFHPIVGDTTHGDGRHNQLYRDQYGVNCLLLMASRLSLVHPFTHERLSIVAQPTGDMARVMTELPWVTSSEPTRESSRHALSV